MPRELVKTFLGMSMRVFLEGISISAGELSEADGLPQCEWASSSLLRAQIEPKARERVNSLSLLEERQPSFSALLLQCFWLFGFLTPIRI